MSALPFSSLPPSSLSTFLNDSRTLVLDIRPRAAHAAARIHNAISLSVPTTLLKRPLFSLAKLSIMLPSPSSRTRFANWSSASCILVYDSDSILSPDNSIIAGLLRKFRAEGFTGELAWVCGGFQAVWKEARHLVSTDRPLSEEDDTDPASSSGALRASHLPKAAFSLSSTVSAPRPHLAPFLPSYPLTNTPAPSASRAANPFFDTIRQNTELSHGITERIPLRLPRRVRTRIHDLPFPWLRDIARRSALRHSSPFRHPGLDTFESGSESSDDPHTSDPDENDPNVEEGAETLAMQFYRIELAEQRRLRSIMEHHTRESEFTGLAYPAKPRRSPGKDTATLGTGTAQSGVSVRTGAKSAPGTPFPAPFPFSITAAVEKGSKNRYTHIWPFEHARVRLHDVRHLGSHPGRRDKRRVSERGRTTRDQVREKGGERLEQDLDRDQHRRSHSSPGFGNNEQLVGASPRYFYCKEPSSITGPGAAYEPRPTFLTLDRGIGVPQVKIEYDVTDDSRISGPSTPATALPFPTPPFYTPMEISSLPTPMHAWSPHSMSLPPGVSASPGTRSGRTQLTLPSPSFPLRLPNHLGSLLQSIGEQTLTSESQSSSNVPSGGFPSRLGTVGEVEMETGSKPALRREPSTVDDYVNASYVQPLGTRKRYIATQGPLPSTYVDFWTLVWEQNVHVIVMLTREVENAMVKCGSYWTDTEYGPLRLELLSTSPPVSSSVNTSVDTSRQEFLAIREPRKRIALSGDQSALITRVFSLTHTSYPGVPPRRITHLQYLDWSDMNVPDDPRGVLDLVKKLEHVVAETTPGPSPSGSLSPGSASGSLSGSQSPDTGPGYGMPLLSPSSAGFMPRRGKGRRGSEWRNPELDAKTGVAAFALGKSAPVLLHCSAGVGRTGGFIAVDAVLDGIRRELRRKREERSLIQVSGTSIMAVTTEGADIDGAEANGDLDFESTEAGTKSVEISGRESASDGSERMAVDELAAVKMESKTFDPLHMINTVPIHVSAGDRTKGRRRRRRESASEKTHSSSESLVVHVPYVGSNSVPEETKVAGIDLGGPNSAGWQSSSTREWVEQISDQTHVDARIGDRHPTSLPLSSRERSPGSASTGSGPSMLNSADDSLNGSINANASGSASGSGNHLERENGAGSVSGSGPGSASGNWRPPSSLVSKLGSGSTSLSNSGSGSGKGSRRGSSLLRVRLKDSSATSISTESTDSLSQSQRQKPNPPLHGPSSGAHISSSSDMEVDYPAPPVSVPLRPIHSNVTIPQRTTHPKMIPGPSPIGRLSSPTLPHMLCNDTPFTGGGAVQGPASRSRSEPRSDGSPHGGAGGESADTEGSRRNSQISSDDPETRAISSMPRSNLRLNTELSSLRTSGAHGDTTAETPLLASGESHGRKRVTISPVHRVLDDSALQQLSPAYEVPNMPEYDQRNVEHPVIDYKLPRQLHSELSPPLISSFAEPICTVIQDMREQRMSLCQSLRQYVFVHAAIIEGALRIVDEEREFWECVGSDDASSGEGEPVTNFGRNWDRSGRKEEPKAWFARPDVGKLTITMPELEHRNIPHRIQPLHVASQAFQNCGSEIEMGGSQIPYAPASSSSSVSSPSKGKRGPSPTELLREDKTGALSLNKRPSIQRQTTHHEGNSPVNVSPTGMGRHGGGSRDATVGACATQPAPGRPGALEKGGLTCDRVIFE